MQNLQHLSRSRHHVLNCGPCIIQMPALIKLIPTLTNFCNLVTSNTWPHLPRHFWLWCTEVWWLHILLEYATIFLSLSFGILKKCTLTGNEYKIVESNVKDCIVKLTSLFAHRFGHHVSPQWSSLTLSKRKRKEESNGWNDQCKGVLRVPIKCRFKQYLT